MRIYTASLLLPINGSPVEGGAVVVRNGRITAVGKRDLILKKFTAPVYEFPGAVLMPGLVNAHTHLELTHYPQWLAQSSLVSTFASYIDWILQVIHVKRQVGYGELSASLLDGISQSIQNGTTMVGDILSERQLIPLYKKTLLSGRVFLEFLGQNTSRYTPLLESLGQDIDSLPGNMLPGISPHSPFTVSKLLLKDLLLAARSRKIPLAMHLAESRDESAFFDNASGRIISDLYPFVGWDEYLPEQMATTSTAWLDDAEALAADFMAIHGAHLSLSDIMVLKNRGVSLVLAPRSNHNLAVGKAPVKEMIRAGIPLSLGTDSCASNFSLSLWDEMRFLLDAFPQSFSPDDAIRMATICGAKALKRDSEAGTLEFGKRADFIVMMTGEMPKAGKVCEQLMDDSRVYGVWIEGEHVWSSAGKITALPV